MPRPPVDPHTGSVVGYTAAWCEHTWHVGHARSVYLAYLVCKELNIPFHIKLSMERTQSTPNLMCAMTDLHNMLRFLGVVEDEMYWYPIHRPSDADIIRELGEERGKMLLAALSWPESADPTAPSSVLDDLLTHYPSLIIHGREWENPVRYVHGDTLLVAADRQRKRLKVFYAAAGREMHEFFLPVITLGGYKFGKTEGRLEHWTVLKTLPRKCASQKAREFLVRTACWPHDIWAGNPNLFSMRDISAEPFEWSADVWQNFVEKTYLDP